MTKNILFFVLVSLLLVLAGCSNGKVSLNGKAVFSDDGSPVPVGAVCFETDSFQARGNIKPDGSFVVGSLKGNDGLPPGKYRVGILGAQKLIGEDKRGFGIYESLIDEKFTSGSTSGLIIDVTSSTKHYEVVVDRYQPKAKK